MINFALISKKTDLNDFTANLAARCFNGKTKRVMLRNKTYTDVMYKPADEMTLDDECLFYTPDWEFVWNADGSSVKNQDLDIIEF